MTALLDRTVPAMLPATGLPYNNDAEQGLLGILMVDVSAIDDVADIVTADHFYVPAHKRIFAAIMGLHHRGMAPTPVTLKNQFDGDSDLEKAGGADYLAELAAGVITVVNARDYALTIHDLYQRRAMITACQIGMQEAGEVQHDLPAAQIIEGLEQQLYDIAENGAARSQPVGMQESMHGTIAYIQGLQRGDFRPMRTGIHTLDRMINGLWRKHLVVLAGRPSMGKTALAISIAHNVADPIDGDGNGHSVLMFSLEMSRDELNMRLLARHTGLATGHQAREGSLRPEDWQKLSAASNRLGSLRLAVDETAAISLQQVRARARRHKRRYGLDLIVIDQLSLMALPEGYAGKVDRIGEVTAGLKALAKELDVCVLLLHQLNRGVESREDKRPQLADLRDSGTIEQDADAVLFVYREEYYLERQEPSRGEKDSADRYAERLNAWHDALDQARNKADIIVAKFRSGRVGSVRTMFNGTRQYFHDID